MESVYNSSEGGMARESWYFIINCLQSSFAFAFAFRAGEICPRSPHHRHVMCKYVNSNYGAQIDGVATTTCFGKIKQEKFFCTWGNSLKIPSSALWRGGPASEFFTFQEKRKWDLLWIQSPRLRTFANKSGGPLFWLPTRGVAIRKDWHKKKWFGRAFWKRSFDEW